MGGIRVTYLYALLASLCFSFLYNVRGKLVILTAVGGGLCRFFFDVFANGGLVFQFFFATVLLAIYAEIMARITKDPVMIYLIIGVLPIVPGAGVYNTMASVFYQNLNDFISYGTTTLLGSGAIALGIMVVSSFVRIFKIKKFPTLRQFKERYDMPKMK